MKAPCGFETAAMGPKNTRGPPFESPAKVTNARK